MKDPGECLQEEMSKVKIDMSILPALSELMYTASDRGITCFKLYEEDLVLMLKLIAVAEKYKKRLPAKFRM